MPREWAVEGSSGQVLGFDYISLLSLEGYTFLGFRYNVHVLVPVYITTLECNAVASYTIVCVRLHSIQLYMYVATALSYMQLQVI